MKTTKILFPLLMAIMLTACAAGQATAEDEELARLFRQRGVEGTMIITSLKGDITHLHNKARAKKRFLPASTFKIVNTLIALDEGAVRDEKEVIKWDGTNKGWASWNQDQTIETAFPVSCVWFYQELAKRIGPEKYLDHLKKIGYGNQKTGPDVTTFWLAGDLAISAREQIQILKRLYRDDLPYRKDHQQILKKVMIVQQTPQYTLRAKTGLTARIAPQIGWYVGYVETKENVWFFAVNIEIKDKNQAGFRKEIAFEALRLKGII